jgi:Leucine rich repeat N-terminal domain
MAEFHLLYLLKPFLLLLTVSLAQGGTTGDDIGCLKALNASISDPNGYLSSWDFTNTTAGSICKFNGIECWNQNENRVLNIRLSNMGLEGHFPSGLQLCAGTEPETIDRGAWFK